MKTSTSASGKREILVVVSSFPNRIQPWVLNWIEQICLHGGEPFICAEGRLGGSYPQKVADLGLLEQTRYLNLNSPSSALKSFLPALAPWTKTGREIWRGCKRVVSESRSQSTPLSLALKRMGIAPAAGLKRIALIHSHVIPEAHRFLPLTRIYGAPLIVTFHGLPPKDVPFLPIEKRRQVFGGAALFLVNTNFARRQLEGLGCPTEKIAILPQGLQLEEFPFRPAPPPGKGTLRLLTVGRLHPDKGHEYAIRAVARLLRLGHAVHYQVVGTGPERERLEQLCRELGIQQHVEFSGEADDRALMQAYQKAHIFILASLRDRDGYHEETQGVVIQEAQASGALVVATRTGGIPECVDDQRSAFLVDDRSDEQIADCIDRLVQSQDKWEGWRKLAREWVEQKFDIHVLGDRLWDIYGSVLTRSREVDGSYPSMDNKVSRQ